MDVVVFDATRVSSRATPLRDLPRTVVHVPPDWTVQDVIAAAGLMPFSSFALADAEIEANAEAGEGRTIAAAFNLLGVDENGSLYYQGGRRVLWADFLIAVEQGVYRGDPSRIVVYPYGVAGGLAPDGLWDIVQWLFDHHGVVLGVSTETAALAAGLAGVQYIASTVSKHRRRRIAENWRSRGVTAPRLRRLLETSLQWDPDRLASLLEITALEARLMLTNAGFSEGDDHLWRSTESVGADAARAALRAIEERAQREMGSRTAYEFPPDEGDDEPGSRSDR